MLITIEEAKILFEQKIKISVNSEIYKRSIAQTPFLPKASLKQRLWHIIHQQNIIPSCKMCQSPVKWDIDYNFEYRRYCSHKCLHSDPDIQEAKRQIEIQRYGKGRKTVVEKIKATNRKRYGVDFAIQTEGYKEKKKATCLERYGVDNPSKVSGFIKKREETNIQRYGDRHPSRTAECQLKAENTYLVKSGVRHPSHRNLSAETISRIADKAWLHDEHVLKKKKLTEIAASLGISISAMAKILIRNDVDVNHYHSNVSLAETELYNFLVGNSPLCEIKRNMKDLIEGYEVDFFIPRYNLAIEFNGIYWHSDLRGKGCLYHLNKTQKCSNKGIRLIHIFESEWVNKKHIVLSRLKNVFGVSNRVYARNCCVAVVEKNVARRFLNENHIQASVGFSIAIGLYHNGELISVMTFGRPRFSKLFEYELIRFANKIDCMVVGGASKLFSFFVRNYGPHTVISYSDKRWGHGGVYSHMGFVFSHTTKPNYWYFHRTDTNNLYSRIKFQKHKLEKILQEFNPSLTGWENMVNNGFDRIWDCGNDVFVWRNLPNNC